MCKGRRGYLNCVSTSGRGGTPSGKRTAAKLPRRFKGADRE